MVAEGFVEGGGTQGEDLGRGLGERPWLRRFSDKVSVLDMENMSLVEDGDCPSVDSL